MSDNTKEISLREQIHRILLNGWTAKTSQAVTDEIINTIIAALPKDSIDSAMRYESGDFGDGYDSYRYGVIELLESAKEPYAK